MLAQTWPLNATAGPSTFVQDKRSPLLEATKLHLGASEAARKKYACTWPQCPKSYAKPARLNEHMRSHTNERPFICGQCQASYRRKEHLQAHSRSHRPEHEKTVVCTEEDCDKRFWTNQHLQGHIKSCHGDAQTRYKCDECTESFAKHHLLRSHIADKHSPEGALPFQCAHPGCDKSFINNVKLKRHSKVHDENRYACGDTSCLTGSGPLYFPNWTALQKHNKSEHPAATKRKKRKHQDMTSDSEAVNTAEEASPVKAFPCLVQDCTFSARKEPALARHTQKAHSQTEDVSDLELGESNTLLDLLTGANYGQASQGKRRKLLARSLLCPAVGCDFALSRKYDLERHLKSAHAMDQDQVELLLSI